MFLIFADYKNINQMKTFIILVLSLLSYGAYAQVHEDHTIVYNNGDAVYMNAKDGFSIGVSNTKGSGGIRIDFALINNTGSAVNILHENISAEYIDKKGNKVPLEIFTYEEARKKAKNKALWFGPSNTETINAKTEVKNEYGLTVSTVNTKAEVYTGKADEAYRNVDEQIKGYLRNNTLFDGQNMKGYFLVKKPKAESFTLNIKIKDAVYKYSLSVE